MLKTIGLSRQLTGKNCLGAKLFHRRNVNVEVLKNALLKILRLKHGLLVWEVGEKLFRFQFGNGDQIFCKQP